MRPTLPFFIFALLGLIVGSVVGGGISLRLRYDDVRGEVEKEKERLVSEWELKEIAVTDYELAAGDVLEPEYISIKQLPAQFVSPSFLTPEEANALAGNPVAAHLAIGDPLTRQLVVGADGGATCAPVETAGAYIAKYPLAAGTPLSSSDFELTRIPKTLVTGSVITSIYPVDGELLTHDLEVGDLLLRAHLEVSARADGGDEGFAEDEP